MPTVQDLEAAIGEDQGARQLGYSVGELCLAFDNFLFAPLQPAYSQRLAAYTSIRFLPAAGNRSDRIDNE
jgi:hypothetical protein